MNPISYGFQGNTGSTGGFGSFIQTGIDEETGEAVFEDRDTGDEYVGQEEIDPATGRRGRKLVKRAKKAAQGLLRSKGLGGAQTFEGVTLYTARAAGNAAMGAFVNATVNQGMIVDRVQIQVTLEPDAAALASYSKQFRYTAAPAISTIPMFDANGFVFSANTAGSRWSSPMRIMGGPKPIPPSTAVLTSGVGAVTGGVAGEFQSVMVRLLCVGEEPEKN